MELRNFQHQGPFGVALSKHCAKVVLDSFSCRGPPSCKSFIPTSPGSSPAQEAASYRLSTDTVGRRVAPPKHVHLLTLDPMNMSLHSKGGLDLPWQVWRMEERSMS